MSLLWTMLAQRANGLDKPAKYKPAAATVQSKKGKRFVEQQKCSTCHLINGAGGCLAPPLDGVGSRRKKEFILLRITDTDEAIDEFEKVYESQELMPHIRVDAVKARAIAEYLLTLANPKEGFHTAGHSGKTSPDISDKSKSQGEKDEIAANDSDSLQRQEGRKLFYGKGCAACHSIGDIGGQFAPALDGIGARKSEDEIRSRITDAQMLKLGVGGEYNEKGTTMPPMGLSKSDIEALSTFLHSLKN